MNRESRKGSASIPGSIAAKRNANVRFTTANNTPEIPLNTMDITNKQKTTCFKRILWITLSVLWMILIFFFSSRPADLSSEDSTQVGIIIGQLLHPDFEEWSEAEQEAYAESIDHPVRKTAHACEYAILGILLLSSWTSGDSGRRKTRGTNFCEKKQKRWLPAPLCAWISAALYASSDEFHQLFVPGRSGMIQDVLLDSCGALAGILFVRLLTKLIRRKHTDSFIAS